VALVGTKFEEVSIEEVQEELDRICNSPSFHRSEWSSKFLRYVCDLTLRGEASRINQYLIGSEVFHRGADYSTHEDSIVRRQAHALRQKLAAYYAQEGRGDPIHIELPVGQYVPVFQRQPQDAVVPAPSPEPAKRPRLTSTALASLAAVVLFFGGWVAGRRTVVVEVHPPVPPIAREIWGPWLDDPTDLIICVSNPMTATVKYQANPAPPDLAANRFPISGPEEGAFRSAFDLPPGGFLYANPSVANTKVGESMAVALLATFFTKAARPVRATESRLISWADFRTNDFILLGHNEANPWLDPLLRDYPFRLGQTDGQRLRYIINTSPAEGEASEYQVEHSPVGNQPTQEYALISMIPGLDPKRRLLLVNGLNTQATQMAADLLTLPDRLQQLYSRLIAISPSHKGAWYFQAVIRTEVRDKVPTTGAEIVALRVL